MAAASCLLLLQGCGNEAETELSIPAATRRPAPLMDWIRADLAGTWSLTELMETRDGVLLAFGHDGTIIRSTDRGSVWSAVYSGTDSWLQSAAIATSGALVAVGSDGAIVRSTNAGKSWSPVPSNTQQSFNTVLTTPSGTLIALTDVGIVARSTDEGASWSLIDSGVKQHLRDTMITANGTLIAVGDDAAIIRSLDDGARWEVVHEQADSYLSRLIKTRTGALIALGRTLVRSIDDGVTWSTVHDGLGLEDGLRLHDAIVTARGALVAIGFAGQIMRSEDDGVSWSAVEAPTQHSLSSLASPSPNVLLAAGFFGTLLRSTDDGRNWSSVNIKTSLSLRKIHRSFGAPGALIAVGDDTILRSIDDGVSWSPAAGQRSPRLLGAAIAAPNTFVAVGYDGLIFRSADDGQHWSPVFNDSRGFFRSIALTTRGTLVAASDDGIVVRSLDNGLTWSVAHANTDEVFTVAAATVDGAILVAGFRGTLLRSTDDGASWSTVYSGPQHLLTHMITTPRGAIVAIGGAGKILRSDDAGVSWSPIESGTSKDLDAVITTAQGTLIVAGADGTLMRSSDDGLHWSTAASSTGVRIRDLLETPRGTLLAVGDLGVILRSRDRGASWVTVPTDTKVAFDDVALVPKGALLAVGDDGMIASSHDDGENWVATKIGGDEQLQQVLVGTRGEVVVVSMDGAILSGFDSSARVPVIRRITQQYTPVTGHPLLQFELDDPTGQCRYIGCLTVDARSEADHERGVAPRTLPAEAMKLHGDRMYSIVIDPALLSARRPDPLYVRVRLRSDGYARTYPAADSYFKVANHPEPLYQKLWFVPAVVALVLLTLYTLLVLRPLWLLGLVSRPQLLAAIPNSGLSAFSEFCFGLLTAVLMPVLVRNPRVLDAWVRRHAGALHAGFESTARRAVDRGVPYTPLTMENPDGAVFLPSPHTLAQYLQTQRVSVQLIGAGGSGKTRFAAELGRWLFEARGLVAHPAVAIFINEPFEQLRSIIQDKLRAVLDDATPPVEFIDALLSGGRLWVIVDGLSERSETMRAAVAKIYRAVSVKFMVCTMRYPIDFQDAAVTRLRTRPLDLVALNNFLADQLRAANARDLFASLGDQSDLAHRFTRQLKMGDHEAPVTPLLVRIFVNQAIELVRAGGATALDNLPSSIPEAYFSYVESLDALDHRADTESLRRRELARSAAAAIADVALGEDLRPKPVALATVTQRLLAAARIGDSAADIVQRMIDNGLLMRQFNGTEVTVAFVLDPLAECLAAFEHAKRCGSDAEAWEALVRRVNEGGESTKGFMFALHMVHAAYARALEFPRVDIPS